MVEIILAEGIHDMALAGRAPFQFSLAFALQQSKGTENLSQSSQVVLNTTRCVDLVNF
jgi:hypothetical protein